VRIFLRCLLALAIIWAIAAGAMFWIQSTRPTPQKFVAYIAEHPLAGQDSRKRAKIVERAARHLNGLTFEQRQELKDSGAIRGFFKQLTATERRRFLALTVPDGFSQLIAVLKKMEPVERNRLVQRTLRNVKKRGTEPDVVAGEADIGAMILQGLAIFEEEANPDVKRAFAPVIAEVQRKRVVKETAATSNRP
jgi:hypothetical protein